MELQILLPQDIQMESLTILRKSILNASIDGIEKIEIGRNKSEEGEMGSGDIINSITAIIEAAEKPLVELVKCLQIFVQNYRTEIVIPTKNGNLIMKHGRSMKPEELKKLVEAIQKNNN